jgi:peptidyl-prolyl cis-trans isomerase C
VKQHYVCVAVLLAAGTACQKSPAPSTSAAAATRATSPAAAAPGLAPTKPALETPAPPPAPKPVPAELPAVIARVNGDEIGRAEFEQTVHNVELRAGRQVPAEQRDQVLRGVMDDMIAMRLLKQEVERRRVAATDAELADAMKELRQQFPSEAACNQALKAQKMTLGQLRNETRTQLLVSKMLEQEVGSHVAVTPADISAFYEKNPDRFQQREAVHASHVLITVPQGADAATKAAARAKAQDVLKQARAGADFATLARTYSNDASAPRGGDLGFFPKGQMVPAFDLAAFALAPNQVSDVVETPFGFHVIKVLEKRTAQSVPFGQAAPQIEQYLRQEQQQTKTRVFVQQLRAKGNVEIFI